MDARGLSTLIWADHMVRRADRHLRLAAPTARITRLLAITHLDLYFDLHLTSGRSLRLWRLRGLSRASSGIPVTRIWHRLIDEHGMTDVSYPVVRAYVAERKPQVRAEAGRGPAEVFVRQSHRPGGSTGCAATTGSRPGRSTWMSPGVAVTPYTGWQSSPKAAGRRQTGRRLIFWMKSHGEAASTSTCSSGPS
jgi:hypothetical protein